MTKLKLPWTVGNVTQSIEIVLPQGAAGLIQVMKDSVYLGQLVKYGDQWFGSVNTPEIGAEEIQLLGEAVEKAASVFPR